MGKIREAIWGTCDWGNMVLSIQGARGEVDVH